jgi:hypothetical protein
MNGDETALLLAVLKIIWINLLLSGDNAVLIWRDAGSRRHS